MDTGTKLAIIIFIICSFQSLATAKKCTRPNVKRKQVFIYRTIGNIDVKVYRCLYNDTRSAYSDISDQCVSAFKTRKFLDKWDQTYNIADANSPIVLEQYVATADPLRNIIYLRSGSLCRFDRGFCYDPVETLSYAAVWNVFPVPSDKCPAKLEQVFYGHVDVWSFSPENQIYLFFYDSHSDKSFSLKLINASTCYGKPVWFTNERGYVVSLLSLTQNFHPIKKLNKEYFPLKSKRLVSEAVLKDCDLSAYSLDFDEQINSDYLSDPKNLKVIFKLQQKQIGDNKNYVLGFAKNLIKIRAALEGKNKELNNIKVMLALYKMQFDSINNSINSLYQNMNGNGYQQKDYDKLILNVKDLSKRILQMSDTITHLENSNKMILSSNHTSKEDLERTIANLKLELKKNYLTFNNNISNSEISNTKKIISEIKETIEKLESKIVTANNYTKICNERVDIINIEFKKSLNDLKKELSQNAIILKTNMTAYVDIADNIILKKLDLLNSQLHDLEEKIKNNIFKNGDDLKTTIDKLEYVNKTTTMELDKFKYDLKILDNSFHTNYIAFDQKLEDSKKLFKNEMMLVKDLIATGNKNLKNEIIDMYLIKVKNLYKDFIKVNGSLSSRINFSDSKIKDIEEKLNNIKIDADNYRNSIDVYLKDIIKDMAQTSQKLNTTTTKIEEQILKKLNSTLNSIDSKSNKCINKIENLKRDTNNIYDNLKQELTQLSKRGDEIVNKNLEKVKDSISNKIILDDTKVREFEKKLNEFRDFAENNQMLTHEGLQEIRRNISGIFDFVKQGSLEIDNNILIKYNSILSILDDKSNNCMQEIANLKNNFENSNNDLKENIFQISIETDKNFIAILTNVNNSLLFKINSSNLKIEELETKIGQCQDNIKYLINKHDLNVLQTSLDETNKFIKSLPSEIEDELIKKINPSLNSLQKNNDNFGKEIKDLKGNVKKRYDDLTNEIFITFSSTDKDLQKVNDSVLQIVNVYDKRIKYLENKTKSLSQDAKAKNPSNAKVEYLIKQADSTYKTLEDAVDEINIVKVVQKKLNDAINNLNLDNNSKELYLSNLNQTVVRNTNFIKQLKDDINSLSNSRDIADIDKQFQKLGILIQKNSDEINKLHQNQQKTDKIIDGLNLYDKENQQQLKEFQQEIKTLRNNISFSNKLISDNDKTIIDLRSQIEDLKINNIKKEYEFTDTLSDFKNILNRFSGVNLKKELADLKTCCTDKGLKLIENEKEIKKLKDEFGKAINELKTEQDKLKNILNNYQEVDAV